MFGHFTTLCMKELSNFRIKNLNSLTIGNLNINSVGSKFKQLRCLFQDKVDTPVITEGKSDSFFFHLKLFYSFSTKYIYKIREYYKPTKQKFMLHFPKVI